MRQLLMAVFLLASGVACRATTLEALPLVMTLDANPSTGAPGDSISFVVGAQGGQLFGVEIDFGDGATDQRSTFSARTARVTFRHAYGAPGTYTTRAVVTDALAGQRDASVEVKIQ